MSNELSQIFDELLSQLQALPTHDDECCHSQDEWEPDTCIRISSVRDLIESIRLRHE